jgi:hypothetical protein
VVLVVARYNNQIVSWCRSSRSPQGSRAELARKLRIPVIEIGHSGRR